MAFSHIANDARVLRHLRFLGEHYNMIAIGYGEDPSPSLPDVTLRWERIEPASGSMPGKILRTLARWPGRIIPAFDWLPDKMMPDWRAARRCLRQLKYDLFLGNDVSALLLGAWQYHVKGKRFVMDYHEFAPLEAENEARHRWFHGPHSHRLLQRYGRLASGSSTVNRMFAERFERDYGFPAVTVMNAPELMALPEPQPRPDARIHLVFHGNPGADRNVEALISAMALLDQKYALHLMLMSGTEPGGPLRRLAESAAPDRIMFEDTVPPAKTAARLSAWDIGFNILTPHNYNNRHALPNKFFDYIHAGLATVCSDTVTAREFVTEHGIGWVLDEVSPQSIAGLVQALTPEQIRSSKAASLRLRDQIHARSEESRIVAMVDTALAGAA